MYKKKSLWLRGLLGASGLFLWGSSAYADISGTVFLDYNLNGQLDSTSKIRNLADTLDISMAVDNGIAGAQVKAECVTASGISVFGPVTTDASGQFTLATTGAVAGAGNCLLQLASLPTGYSVGSQGVSSGANVLTQFISPSTTAANFAVKETTSYCQNNPELATSRYAAGQQIANSPYGGNSDVPNLLAFPYNSGVAGAQGAKPAGYNTPDETAQIQLALAKEVGSVFGLGWHPASKSLFSAAYMKPWTGFGPSGTGGIYRTDISDPAHPVTNLYADLNQIFPATPATAGVDPYLTGAFSASNPGYAQIADGSVGGQPKGSYVASGDATRDNQDGQIAAAIGKAAFGDLDVSADGQSLFTVNMADRQLYVLPVQASALTAADASKIARYPIPFEADCVADGVSTFDKQAFGLGEYQEGLYIATRCDTSPMGWGDFRFVIYRFDLQTKSFAAVPSLNYKVSGDIYMNYYGVPSDIVFDQQGDMVLAFRNLGFETMTGSNTPYGAVRHACVQDAATHTWAMESNGSCGGVTTAGAGSGQGPNGGDFFFQEWPSDQGAGFHVASYGGAAHIPGFLESAHTVADPFPYYGAGVSWVDLGLGDPATAGQRKRAYELYNGTGGIGAYADNRPISGKNAAIGDLEVLCDPASIEIGNRVWQDTNSNGIQDAGELPLAGVQVELFAQGVDVNNAIPLATALTDADGYYVFSSDPRGYPTTGNSAPNDIAGANGGFDAADLQGGRASTSHRKFGITSLLPNKHYQVVIRNVDGVNKQAALAALMLTTTIQGTDQERDSDGGLVGVNAVSDVSTLEAGYHYHAVDFGFKSVATPTTDLSLTKAVDNPNPKRGATVVYTLTVTNQGTDMATGVEVTDVLPTRVTYVSDDGGGSYNLANGVWMLGDLAVGSSKTLKITATVQ